MRAHSRRYHNNTGTCTLDFMVHLRTGIKSGYDKTDGIMANHLYRSLVSRSYFLTNSRLLSSLTFNLSRKTCFVSSRKPATFTPEKLCVQPGLLLRSTYATDCLSYEMLDNGRKVKFTWANGETAAFHAVWLRHNCQCPSCETSSNQKAINPSVVDPNMSVTSTSVSGRSIL